MNTTNNQNPSSDPELDKLLEFLREIPARDPRAVERGRAKFISDVDQVIASNKTSKSSWLESLLAIVGLGRNQEQAGLRRSMKLSYSIALVVLVLVVILFSGAGATAYAAKSALPGDALYRVKMSIEQTQVRLAADAAKLAELHLEFAERRLEEILGLIAEGRYGEIEQATQEFEYHVQQALIAMKTVAAGDPQRAQELAARVTAALSEYARSLSGMLMNVPESTSASMQRAIITSQNAGNISPVEINENENDNTNENLNVDDGNFNGDDQENGQSNQNGDLIDENENEDQNGEDHTNVNSNENEDDNENQENQNSDDDQDSNSNLNDQENDNQNDSGDGNDSNDDDDGDDSDDGDGNDNDNDRDNGDNDNDSSGNDNDGDD